MYSCPVRWYTVVDEMSVDEMSVDELWNPSTAPNDYYSFHSMESAVDVIPRPIGFYTNMYLMEQST